MAFLDIIYKFRHRMNLQSLLRMDLCLSAADLLPELQLQFLLVVTMLLQSSLKCPVMRKCQIIGNIVNDLPQPAPVYACFSPLQITVYGKHPYLLLYHIKGSEKLVLCRHKRRFAVRKNASQSERFYMCLQFIHRRVLSNKASQRNMRFFSQNNTSIAGFLSPIVLSGVPPLYRKRFTFP